MIDTRQRLTYRTVSGEDVDVGFVVVGRAEFDPASLHTRVLALDDGTHVLQVLAQPRNRVTGYQRLDNEMLAGLRLARVALSVPYPRQVSCLVGYSSEGADPFVLLEPHRGRPAGEVAGHLLPDGQHRFQLSLLTGLRWLAEAGIVHRGINPTSVRWDGQDVQITDFSLSTVVGASRDVVGTLPWAAAEQRPGQADGLVTERDDVWAAGRLIFLIVSGEEFTDLGQLDDWPAISDLLAGVFCPVDERPTARQMLVDRLRAHDPVPRGLGGDQQLERFRAEFYALRAFKRADADGAGSVDDDEVVADPLPPALDDAPSPGRQARRWLRFGGLVKPARTDG